MADDHFLFLPIFASNRRAILPKFSFFGGLNCGGHYTGLPWRDLPSFFGVWISIYQQFNRWSSKDKLMKIFKALVNEPDLEWEFIDGSIVKAHQHSTGAASDEDGINYIFYQKSDFVPQLM